ncbi:hypothetical protein [Tritonibacter mobilis]|nr:hypothetical protein [Tritonibacter mobilis]
MSFVSDTLGGLELDRLVEMGCGQGKITTLLDSTLGNVKRYIGIDLYISKLQWQLSAQDTRIEFLEGCVEQKIDEVGRSGAGTSSFLSVNFLCYLDSLDKFLTVNGGSIASSGEDLLIIEPFPSIFWETWFDGIFIQLRSPSEMRRFFEDRGWKLCEVRKLYLFQIFGLNFWPVSYGLHFKMIVEANHDLCS